MTYDGHGRQARWIFPSKTTPGVADQTDYEQYLYDANGNRRSLRKRDGQVIGFDYDALNRVWLKTVPEFGLNVRYTYDLRGLQLSATFTGTGQGVTNVYDGFGRMTSTTTHMGAFSRTVSHQYDREGRRIELTFPDGQKFWTARDGLGRAVEDYQGAHGSTSNIMTAFAYNAAGQRSQFYRKYGDNTSYGYDAAGRLNAQNDNFIGGIGNTSSTYVHNPANQLFSESRSNDSYAWTGSVAVSRNYVTNGQNQYTGTTVGGAQGATFTHDANGNLTASVNPPYSTTYAYDSENRLVSASGTENATLVYDPLGRLFQIHSPATGLTQFLYDGDELVAEYFGWGNLARRYIHGDGSDDPLFWFEGPGLDQPRFPHTNHQGSVTAVAGTGATPLYINTYDEYGRRGANNQGRFQYTGQAWIPELGMYYYKARIYSPTLGRFLQVDPIGYDDQVNLYAYVSNDPINGTDPDGQEGIFQWIGDSAKMVAKDLSNLGASIGRGDFQHAFGGMPPMMGGGFARGGAAVASRVSTYATGSRLARQAANAGRAARAEAAAARAAGHTKGATSGLVTRSGQTFTGRSTHSGGPGRATHSSVERAVQDAPQGNFPGCCAEVNAISKALNAGANVRGGFVATVRTTTDAAMKACPTCAAVLKNSGYATDAPDPRGNCERT